MDIKSRLELARAKREAERAGLKVSKPTDRELERDRLAMAKRTAERAGLKVYRPGEERFSKRDQDERPSREDRYSGLSNREKIDLAKARVERSGYRVEKPERNVEQNAPKPEAKKEPSEYDSSYYSRANKFLQDDE